MASPFIKPEPNMENSSPAGPSARPSRPPLSEVQNKPAFPSHSYLHDEFKANKQINEASEFATGVPEDPTTVNSTDEDLKPPEKKKSDLQWQKLLKKIKERSVAADDTGAFEEWVYISCTKSIFNTGVCLCGNTNLRYLFGIKNIKNGKVEQLGTHCLRVINGNLGGVLRTAKAMFVEHGGRLVHLIAQQDDELKCQICKDSSIIKYRTELEAMYPGGIPLDQDSLIARAGCDEARQMIAGWKYSYRIRVKLYVEDDNADNLTLKAEVINATLMN